MGIASALDSIKTSIDAARTTLTNLSGPLPFNTPNVWSSSATYHVGPPADTVYVAGPTGGSYVCVATNTNVNPTTDDGSHWRLLISNGVTGAQGNTGNTGQGFANRGTWAQTTLYSALDVVFTGTSPNQQVFICATPHTSTSSFDTSKWAPGTVQGPAGMAIMVWNGAQYVKPDGSPGRPSSSSAPGGTVFYIGPSTPSDAVTNDPWFNYSTA